MGRKNFGAAAGLLAEFRSGALDCTAKRDGGPCHPMVAFTLGNARMMQGRYDLAEPQYASAVAMDPAFTAAWQNLGRVRYENGRFEKAGAAFLQAYGADEKKRPEILYFAAAAFFSGAKPARALKAFQQLESVHDGPLPLDWTATRVRVYLALDLPGKALPLIRTLAEKTDGKAQRQWREVLLHQYLALGMKLEARKYAIFLTRQEPESPVWWKALAHLHLLEGRHRQALVAMTVYSHLTAPPPAEKELLADLNLHLSIPARAAKIYEEILKESFRWPLAEKLVTAFRRMHRPDLALSWVEKGLATDEGHRPALLLRGGLLFELERFREAAAAYEKASAAGPAQGRAWLMAGYAAVHAGDMETARRALGRAAAHDRQKKAARQALKQIGEQ